MSFSPGVHAGLVRAALLLSLAMLLSGCFASEAATTPDGSDAPAGEPAPDAPAGDADGALPATSREPIEIRHDYSGAAETLTFEVVEGFYDIRISWHAPESVMGCVSADARIVVTTPEGETYADITSPSVQTPCDGSGAGKQSKELVQGGTWTADFAGSGVAVALIQLEPL